MVNLSRIIWLGIGVLGTYVIVTRTNFLGDFVGYIQKKSPPMSSMPPMPQTSTAPTAPTAPPTPSPPVPQSTPQPQNQPSPPTPTPTPSVTPPTPPDNNIEGQQPSIPQSVPGRGPTSTAPVPPPPQPQPIKTKTGRTSNNLGNVGSQSQSQVQPTVPVTSPTQTAPQQSVSGNIVGRSTPTQNTGFTNGCGRSEGRDVYISCRAGIGTGSNGRTTKESGNQKTPVSGLLSDKNHFYARYHFQIDPSSTVVKGHPQDTEITGGYNGSNKDEAAIGVTIGIKPDGTPFAKKEDEPHSKFEDLCMPGQCGGVSKVPNLGNAYDIVWAADKNGNSATYRGYVITSDGKEYQIANLMPGIDFTNQNGYIRGRSNQLGNIVPSGTVSNGMYMSGGGGSVPNAQPQTPPTAGTPSASNKPSTKKKSSFAGIRSMNFVTTA